MTPKEFFKCVAKMRREQIKYGSTVERLSRLELRFMSEIDVDNEIERVSRLYEEKGLDKFWEDAESSK